MPPEIICKVAQRGIGRQYPSGKGNVVFLFMREDGDCRALHGDGRFFIFCHYLISSAYLRCFPWRSNEPLFFWGGQFVLVAGELGQRDGLSGRFGTVE